MTGLQMPRAVREFLDGFSGGSRLDTPRDAPRDTNGVRALLEQAAAALPVPAGPTREKVLAVPTTAPPYRHLWIQMAPGPAMPLTLKLFADLPRGCRVGGAWQGAWLDGFVRRGMNGAACVLAAEAIDPNRLLDLVGCILIDPAGFAQAPGALVLVTQWAPPLAPDMLAAAGILYVEAVAPAMLPAMAPAEPPAPAAGTGEAP